MLVTDAIKFAIGGALQQENVERDLQPLLYFSRCGDCVKVNQTLIQGYMVEIHSHLCIYSKIGKDQIAWPGGG